MSATSETITELDNILVFIARDHISNRRFITRVLRQDTAATLFPLFVDSATGRIPEGAYTMPEDEPDINVFKAVSLAIPAELIRTLLGLHAQELDYARLNAYAYVEGYGDWLREWRAAMLAAMTHLTV